MVKYFDSIRQWKMSESAWTTLLALADARAGLSSLVCEQGRPYRVSYSTASCYRSQAPRDSVQADLKRKADLANAEFLVLQRLADTDSSGFVSSPEAIQLKRLIEFGAQFPVVVQTERADTNLVLFCMSMNRRDLEATLADYRNLSNKLVALGREPLPTVTW